MQNPAANTTSIQELIINISCKASVLACFLLALYRLKTQIELPIARGWAAHFRLVLSFIATACQRRFTFSPTRPLCPPTNPLSPQRLRRQVCHPQVPRGRNAKLFLSPSLSGCCATGSACRKKPGFAQLDFEPANILSRIKWGIYLCHFLRANRAKQIWPNKLSKCGSNRRRWSWRIPRR